MSIFDFVAPGVEQALGQVRQQLTASQEVEANLRRVLAPLEDGGWIGEGAEAFFLEMAQLLQENDRLQQELIYFLNALNQARETVITTMQSIDNITQMIR